eukprot:7171028-Prymnesium_polylepis.1
MPLGSVLRFTPLRSISYELLGPGNAPRLLTLVVRGLCARAAAADSSALADGRCCRQRRYRVTTRAL